VTVPELVVPVDVAVVDPDLLWRVEVMNALDGIMVKDVVTVFGAIEHLTPGHPAVVVLGPAGAIDSAQQLLELRTSFPGVRVVAVEGPLVEPELGELTDAPRLSLVPDLPDEDPAAAPGDDAPSLLRPAPLPGAERRNDDQTRELIDRAVPAGTTLEDLVRIIHEELAFARGRATHDESGTVFRTLAGTQIIVVTSAKGGDGATTVAANLAAALATQGRAVGLVEGDPVFGDLALVLALPVPAPGLATDPETGIRLVMPARPDEAFGPVDVDLLFDQLSEAEPPFDVVVIEAPPSIAERSGLAGMADHLLVVCSSHLSSIKNAVILVEVLKRHDNLGVVVNRVGRKGLPRHELEETLRAHVVAQLPATPTLALERPDQPPALASPKTAFAKEIDRFAAQLTPADRKG